MTRHLRLNQDIKDLILLSFRNPTKGVYHGGIRALLIQSEAKTK